ncbi:hypothetical protein O5173_26510, partial [Escherichia coli]|nr:hypothetical protein [Escherichia coli]
SVKEALGYTPGVTVSSRDQYFSDEERANAGSLCGLIPVTYECKRIINRSHVVSITPQDRLHTASDSP